MIQLFVALSGGGRAEAEEVIPPGQEGYFRSLVDRASMSRCGYDFRGISIAQRAVSYRFVDRASGVESAVVLRHPSTCSAPVEGPRSSFCVEPMALPSEELSNECPGGLVGESVIAGIMSSQQAFEWTIVHPNLEQAAPPNTLSLSRRETFSQDVYATLLLLLFVGLIITTAFHLTKERNLAKSIDYFTLLTCLLVASVVRHWADAFPANIRYAGNMAWDSGHRWTAGYSAFQSIIFRFFPENIENLSIANLVIGSLTVGVVYLLTRTYFRDVRSAQGAAALAAFHPLLARYSVSDSAHVLAAFSLCMALCFGCLWARRGSFHFLIQATGWLALAGNVRIEGTIYGLSLIAILVGSVERWSSRRIWSCVVAGIPALALLVLPVWEVLKEVGHVSGTPFNVLGLVWNPFFFGTDAPKVTGILALIGTGILLRRQTCRWRGAWWLGALVPVTLPTFWEPTDTLDAAYHFSVDGWES
jgi:hypothetical protein